ncbi:c-type cytochrome [bacterium AH-315-C20]|nr:c-type cytochrome [bacterium AH-315-C20]
MKGQHAIIIFSVFLMGCGPPEQNSDQKFWDPEKDTAWQDHLASQGMEYSEGEKLYDVHCASCHFPFSDMNGPALRGSKDRWREYSNEHLFYDAVRDFESVVELGDEYAVELKEKWELIMPPNDLTNSEIDMIFLYIEGY